MLLSRPSPHLRVLMSNKQPMKFLPPDDPTAVYPIGALRDVLDDQDDPTPAPAEPTPEALPEGALEPMSPAPTERANSAGGINPLFLTLGFLGGGVVLAVVVLGVIVMGLYLFQ